MKTVLQRKKIKPIPPINVKLEYEIIVASRNTEGQRLTLCTDP